MGPHFLDAWTSLTLIELLRLLLPAGFVLLAALLPGRTTARAAAAGTGVALLLVPEPGLAPRLLQGWTLLWMVLAWMVGRTAARPEDEDEHEPAPHRDRPRAGGLEAGAVGLMIAPVLLVVLLAVIAQLDLAAAATRRASLAVALVSFGVLHLMMRRHLLRAAIGFAAIGLGLELLSGVAAHRYLDARMPGAGAPLLAAAIALGLSSRLARGRERAGGTAWVGDAHDLHD